MLTFVGRSQADIDQPTVNQAAQRQRKHQGGHGRHHQKKHGQTDPAAVGAQKRHKARE
ncbi:hypothetical protein LP414_01310 [Polaromonas sp. P1(28)-13]|nr:hypothetical protein LP414_01310 [Polaromonas sp. P1(28)-13]